MSKLPGSVVRDDLVHVGDGDHVLGHLLVVRHAGVLEPVAPQDLIGEVGGAYLGHDHVHADEGEDGRYLDSVSCLRCDPLHGQDDLKLHLRTDVPRRHFKQGRLLVNLVRNNDWPKHLEKVLSSINFCPKIHTFKVIRNNLQFFKLSFESSFLHQPRPPR